MILNNIRIAIAALKGTKTRTILTMTGIIIGVASVSLIMAFGEGLKQQVGNEANHFGTDTIEIRPGKLEETSFNNLGTINPLRSSSPSTLNENDITVIQNTEGVAAVAPFMFVTGSVKYKDNQLKDPFIVATTDQLPDVLPQNVTTGEFFYPGLQDNVVVIGKNVANELLDVDDQVGGKITIRGQEFTVIGIVDNKGSTGIFGGLAPNFNDIIMVPLTAGKEFYGGSSQVQQINVKVDENADINNVLHSLRTNLLTHHNGEEDFTVATKEAAQDITNSVIHILTIFTATVASISLLVGGIGIMNIMFVSVTERTREIGIRKSIGATNGQILGQFLIEAVVISVSGGIIGIVLAYILSWLVTLRFDLAPIITLTNLILSFSVAVGVGIIFGVVPAIKAARKDPIKALRYE